MKLKKCLQIVIIYYLGGTQFNNDTPSDFNCQRNKSRNIYFKLHGFRSTVAIFDSIQMTYLFLIYINNLGLSGAMTPLVNRILIFRQHWGNEISGRHINCVLTAFKCSK